MAGLPIFQMVIEQECDGEYSLSFSNERDDYVQPCFVIPLRKSHPELANEYYMPGEIDGREVNFSVSRKEDFFVLSGHELLYDVRFKLLLPWDRFLPAEMTFLSDISYPYKGTYSDFIYPYERFTIIVPLDLLIMDELYKQQKACFVGLTPVFGNKVNEHNEGAY